MVTQPDQEWVLLSYRLPREPSTPRIKIWRRLKNLGVAQLGDGLVALPSDARTKEHLEWTAEQVREAGGQAMVWAAVPTARRNSAELADHMRRDRDLEYQALLTDIEQHRDNPSPRSVQRWRRQWQRISRRDYFRGELRDQTRLAINATVDEAETREETQT